MGPIAPWHVVGAAATIAAAPVIVVPAEAAELRSGSLPLAVEEALARLEDVLRVQGEQYSPDLDAAVVALKEVAVGLPNSDEGMDVQLQKSLLAIATAAEALNVPDIRGRVVWFTSSKPSAFRRLSFLRRAQLLMTEDWTWAGKTRLSALAGSLGRRWPRTSMIPGRVLRSLQCRGRVSNASLARWLAIGAAAKTWGSTAAEMPCLPELAIFDAAVWRKNRFHPQAGEVDFYRAITPQMGLRPVMAGKAADTELVRLILDKYVTDASGLFLEFGVYVGTSLNVIARHLQVVGGGRVYGFDSFEGLPSAWHGAGADGDLPQGTFRLKGLPEVEANAELVVGLFNETLPRFLEAIPSGSDGVLRLVHLDADLYSSTYEVLMALRPFMQSGCLLVMDDMVNFPGFKDSGLRALGDFLADESSPPGLEVLAAPWHIFDEPEELERRPGEEPLPWDPRVRSDLERAVAFRIQ